MNIKIFGTGCCNCSTQYNNVKEAVERLKIDCQIEKVEDLAQIAMYSIVATPAVAIDESLVSQGSILSVEQVIELLNKFSKPKCSCCGCC